MGNNDEKYFVRLCGARLGAKVHEAIAYGAVVGDEVVVRKSSNSWCVMCE